MSTRDDTDPTKTTFERLRTEAALARRRERALENEALDERFAALEARWDETKFREALAESMPRLLRDAAREGDSRMASSIAPHVVGTVRKEFFNSQDQLAEALHPKMGVMIREAVANAVKELQRQIDEALPVDLWLAQMKARLSGASSLGALVPARPFVIHEAYLVERGSGRLLAREAGDGEPDAADAFDDDLLAGLLAAIDSFAQDVFGTGGSGTLRRVEMNDQTIYLRASPMKIMALRCSGEAPPHVEARIDMLLERTIAQTQIDGDGVDTTPLLEAAQEVREQDSGGAKLVLRLLGGIAGIVLTIWGHAALESANLERWREATLAAARDDSALDGYPLSARHEAGAIVLEGLLPDPEAGAALAKRIAWSGVPVEVRRVLPVAGTRWRP